MPPGFGVLDAILFAIPIFLALLGLIRGAPVELASCLGTVVGAAAAWAISNVPFVAGLGQPIGPLLCLCGGIVAWRIARDISNRLGLDTRWIDIGRLFDSAVGFVMGGARGIAFVSAACLAYAMIFVPFGMASPLNTVAYPVFLALGSQVTSTVMAETEPAKPAGADGATLVSAPLPLLMPHVGTPDPAVSPAPALPPPPPPIRPASMAIPAAAPAAAGMAVTAMLHALAPSAVAAPVRPAPIAVPQIPVRKVPVWLVETHHNIAHPGGYLRRRLH